MAVLKKTTSSYGVKKWGVNNRNLLDPREVKPKRIARPSNYRKWDNPKPNDQSRY